MGVLFVKNFAKKLQAHKGHKILNSFTVLSVNIYYFQTNAVVWKPQLQLVVWLGLNLKRIHHIWQNIPYLRVCALKKSLSYFGFVGQEIGFSELSIVKQVRNNIKRWFQPKCNGGCSVDRGCRSYHFVLLRGELYNCLEEKVKRMRSKWSWLT